MSARAKDRFIRDSKDRKFLKEFYNRPGRNLTIPEILQIRGRMNLTHVSMTREEHEKYLRERKEIIAKRRSDAARKAWDTIRAKKLKEKRRQASLKAWETIRTKKSVSEPVNGDIGNRKLQLV